MKITKILSLILIYVLLLSSASCDRLGIEPGLPIEDLPLMSIMMVSVPGGECGGWIERVEEDSYGRILFKGTPSNLVSRYYCKDGVLFGYFICQKILDGSGYYYEDLCYILKHNLDEISDEELLAFKQENDWENTLCEEKMSKVKTLDNYYDNLTTVNNEQIKAVKTAFESLTNEKWKNHFNNSSKSHSVTPSCTDKEGRLLVYVLIYPSYAEDSKNDQKTWAIILQPDNTFNENACVLIEDPLNCQKTLIQLKKQNGWVKQ